MLLDSVVLDFIAFGGQPGYQPVPYSTYEVPMETAVWVVDLEDRTSVVLGEDRVHMV